MKTLLIFLLLGLVAGTLATHHKYLSYSPYVYYYEEPVSTVQYVAPITTSYRTYKTYRTYPKSYSYSYYTMPYVYSSQAWSAPYWLAKK